MKTAENKNQFITTAEVKEQGRGAYYKMLENAREGNLICIRRGIYARAEQLADAMIDLNLVIPGGVLCYFSAWNVHKLSTSLPQAYHVAVKRGRKIVLPEYPPIELHHITDNLFEIGLEEMVVCDYKIRIYNLERCVCDAVKYRNKIGQDVCAEILKNYLARPERDLSRLMDYADKLRVTSIIRKYLEIQL